MKKLLWCLVIFIIVSIAAFMLRYFVQRQPAIKHDAMAVPEVIADKHRIIDCAALIAVHESQQNGALQEGSTILNLVGYGLGKAQELSLQAAEPLASVREEYDQKTLSYFMAYMANKEQHISTNNVIFTECQQLLAQFEPQAQIKAAVEKAQSLSQ